MTETNTQLANLVRLCPDASSFIREPSALTRINSTYANHPVPDADLCSTQKSKMQPCEPHNSRKRKGFLAGVVEVTGVKP